jgi:hypothetical protein
VDAKRITMRPSERELAARELDADTDLAELRGLAPAALAARLEVALSTAAGQRRVLKLLARLVLALWRDRTPQP